MEKGNGPEESLIFLFIVAAVALLFSIVFTSCSTSEIHSPTLQQIIRPRDGYDGLTNRVCLKYSPFGSCKQFDDTNYDLKDHAVRKMLVDFSFRCSIAGRRFKIHPDKASFARYEEVDSCWLCRKKTIITEEIPMEGNIDYLIKADTYCWSERTYPNGPK